MMDLSNPPTIRQILDRPDPIERMPKTEDLNLMLIELGEGEVTMPDIGWSGWTGNSWKVNPRALGFDGVYIKGKGPGRTIIVPGSMKSRRDACSIMGHDAGVVLIEGASMHHGRRYGILYDNKVREAGWHCLLRLRDFETLPTPPDNGTARSCKWSISSYGLDRDYEGVRFNGFFNSEHIDYGHGVCHVGNRWVDVECVASGGEQSKNVWRPFETPFFTPEAEYYVDRCKFGNWHQDWSDTGGAGITLQGAGFTYMRITNTVMRPKQKAGRCKSVMVDDGLSTIRTEKENLERVWNVVTGKQLGQAIRDGDPVISPNGYLVMRRVGAEGQGTPSLSDMVRVDTIHEPLMTKYPHFNALGVSMRHTAFFGPNTKVNLTDVYGEDGTPWIDARDNNNPNLTTWVQHRLGWLAEDEPRVISHGMVPLSALRLP